MNKHVAQPTLDKVDEKKQDSFNSYATHAVVQKIVDLIHEITWEDLPLPVQKQTVRCLLDIIGTGIAGKATPVSKIIHQYVADFYQGTGAYLWQDGREVSPPGAALANGMTIDALDIHDGHSLTKGHAGAAIVPAAFAGLSLSAYKISGKEFLTLLAIGYEIAIRSGMALHATATDYHTSGAWNAIGCAAIIARILETNTPQTLHALGIAEYHGPRSPMMRCIDQPTMVKDGSGWGAMTGVTAALLAKRGFTGKPAFIIESQSVEPFWNDIGFHWEFLNLYFKPHAVCRWAQPAVEGIFHLKQQNSSLCIENVKLIEIQTFHEATRLSTSMPTTTEQAQYSLPFSVATAFVYGKLGAEELSDTALQDQRIQQTMKRISIIENRTLSDHFPEKRFAHVKVILKDGSHYQVNDVEARWEQSAPPTTEELVTKFRELASEYPQPVINQLEQLILNSPELDDILILSEYLAHKLVHSQ